MSDRFSRGLNDGQRMVGRCAGLVVPQATRWVVLSLTLNGC